MSVNSSLVGHLLSHCEDKSRHVCILGTCTYIGTYMYYTALCMYMYVVHIVLYIYREKYPSRGVVEDFTLQYADDTKMLFHARDAQQGRGPHAAVCV